MLIGVLRKAVAKSNNYLGCLQLAKSCRIFDPRQQPKISNDIKEYTTKSTQQLALPSDLCSHIAQSEWAKYWVLRDVFGPLDLLGLVWAES